VAGGWRWLVAILRARHGLIEGRGAARGRTRLSAQVYQRLGQGIDYIRQAGFGPIQQEQMVLQYVRAQGRIARSEAAES
jgi:ATP-dependent DNA helicase RecG